MVDEPGATYNLSDNIESMPWARMEGNCNVQKDCTSIRIGRTGIDCLCQSINKHRATGSQRLYNKQLTAI